MNKYPSTLLALSLLFCQTTAFGQTTSSSESQQATDAASELLASEKRRHEKIAQQHQKKIQMQQQEEEKQRGAEIEKALIDERELIPALQQQVKNLQEQVIRLKARLNKCLHPYG